MKRFFLYAFAFAALAAQAGAEGLTRAEILQGGRNGDGKPLAAIALTLQQGWKTYWRSPGEGGGIPPEFDWSGSTNLASADILWPAPEVWDDLGMTNIGYHDALILPVALTPIDPTKPVSVMVTINLGICKDICIPAFVALEGDVTGDAPADPQIAMAMANLPQPAAALGAANIACMDEPIKDGLRVTAEITLPPFAQNAAETVVIEHRDRKVWASGAQVMRQGDRLTAVADLVPPSAKPFDLNGDDLRITILAAGRAAEVIGCPLN